MLFPSKSQAAETSKNQLQTWDGAGRGLPELELELGLVTPGGQTHLPVGAGRFAGEVGQVGPGPTAGVCPVLQPQLFFALWAPEPRLTKLPICLKKPTSGCS